MANPSLEVENMGIKLDEISITASKITFKTACYLCEQDINVYVIVSNDRLLYHTSSYSRHIERKHETEGKRITEARVRI